MGWWISRAPELEEDVALANIGLDQLGQARTLLDYAGQVEGAGRSEDDLAYLRDDREFRNVWLVERPQTDFGVTMARLLVFAAYQSELYAALTPQHRPDAGGRRRQGGQGGRLPPRPRRPLGGAARRRHRGVAHSRMQAALDAEWPYVDELFTPADPALVEQGIAVDPAALRTAVLDRIAAVVERGDAGACPRSPRPSVAAAAACTPSTSGYLLAEMQHLARSHPGATW